MGKSRQQVVHELRALIMAQSLAGHMLSSGMVRSRLLLLRPFDSLEPKHQAALINGTAEAILLAARAHILHEPANVQ